MPESNYDFGGGATEKTHNLISESVSEVCHCQIARYERATCPVCGRATVSRWLEAPDRFHGRSEPYALLRCTFCSLVWIDNPPPKEEMRRHYGSKYDSAIAAAGDAAKKWYGRRETLMKFKPGGTILDLGCSSGAFLATLDSSNWKLFGIEMSGAVASRASAINDAEVYVGDILSAPFPDHSFDAVTCFHVFEHLYNPQQVMSRVARWLKPGGIFYMMVPNIDSAGAKTFKSYWYALELPRHLFQFSPASLRVLASRVGLNEVSLVTVREPFIEASTRYVVDDLLRRVGLTRKPLAEAGRPTFLWRIARKAFRITILPILNSLVSTRGDGESIHAIFAKPTAT